MSNRRIKVNLGRTINLEKFESIRIDVGLEIDIKDDSFIEDEFDNAFDKLEGYLDIKSDELERKLSNDPSKRDENDKLSRRRKRN